MPDVGRNDPCPCGSGKKYKKCCEGKDQAKQHAALEKDWAKAQKEFEKQKEAEKDAQTESKGGEKPTGVPHKVDAGKPAVQKHQTIAAPKFNMPRKSGGG